MCGIMCGIGSENVLTKVIAGLKRLEYRGYDSAGVSIIEQGSLKTLKAVGKVKQLEDLCQDSSSTIAIAHTRWATHGIASQNNAHPHSYKNLAWVHNGIINNHRKIRKLLINNGYTFQSETDSEVLGMLFHFLSEEQDPLIRLQKCTQMLEGSYALAIIDQNNPSKILFASKQSPLILSMNSENVFLASDPLAIIDYCDDFFAIPSNTIGYASLAEHKILSIDDLTEIELTKQGIALKPVHASKHDFKHFMHMEIHVQPATIARIIQHFWHQDAPSQHLSDALAKVPESVKMLQFIGCGSSHYAAMIGRYWFNTWSNWLVNCEIASEFRYLKPNTVCPSMLIAISQSGETADTLAAFTNVANTSYDCKATICNVMHSSLARASDITLPILAGQEIGVASTKAFSNQLITLLLFALAKHKDINLWQKVQQIPKLVADTLQLEDKIADIASKLCHEQKMLFLGRGIMYPVALEGALKLKELSYIHAHAYPAGELKHGPLALIDSQLVTIALLNNNNQREKTIANLREIQARHGRLVLFFEGTSSDLSNLDIEHAIQLPELDPMFSPISFTIAMQMLAYQIANQLGLDVDQPRNLAKSVTVE